jgi:nucleotide-binding universal stress UspA family protein
MNLSPSNGPKTILVFLDETEHASARLDYALDIARAFGARMIVLFIDSGPNAVRTEEQPVRFSRGVGIDDAIDRYYAKSRETIVRLKRQLEAGAKDSGLGAEWRTVESYATIRDVAMHCTYADLMIMQPYGGRSDARPWTSPDIVLASGVPGILVPNEVVRGLPRRIVVAWNASRVARRALGDAIPFLARAERVNVLVVDGLLQGSGHGEEPGADIARYLARHGVETTVEQLRSEGADAADVLSRAAARLGADFVVAGAYGHSRVVEIVLGSTTRRLLQEARLPFFIAH